MASEKITIYQKPTCTTCRQVYAALKDSGVDFNDVNYYLEPLGKSKIKELLKKMEIPAAGLLRKKEQYKELGLNEKNLSEEAIVDLMVQYPDLIERPIVERGSRAILARPAETIQAFLSKK